MARLRGFASYEDMMRVEADQVHEKIALACALGSQVVHFDAARNGSLLGPRFCCSQNGLSSGTVMEHLQEMADQFLEWWDY